MLESKLARVEERLGRNPRNSSMPLSPEWFSKPPAPSRAERRAAARKQGKQPRAPGKHLAQVTDPDQVIRDVLGAPVSVGGLAQMVTKAADAPEPFTNATRFLLQGAAVVHFDETEDRAAGRFHWVHSASTSLLTLLDCHPKRGRAAMDDLGVIGVMSVVAIHDGWKPYRHYHVAHALCNAHLRELNTVGVGWDQGWANDLASPLVEAKHSVEYARATGVDHRDATTLHSIRIRFGRLVARGLAANPAPEVGQRSGYEKKAIILLVRLEGQGPACCGSSPTSTSPSTTTKPIGTSAW